jgi:hypothetical protein
MITDAERIERRERRLAEVLAEKAEITAVSSQDGTARDYALLSREEDQIREELAGLRSRS